MVSQAKGYLRIPVWCDDGDIKPIVNDNGRIPVQLEGIDITADVNLESSDITLDVNIKTSEPTVKVQEQSPLTVIDTHEYHYTGTAWVEKSLQLGYEDRWYEELGGTATATSFYGQSSVVPAGEIWILHSAYIRNTVRLGSNLAILVYADTGNHHFLKIELGVVQNMATIWDGNIVLKEDDYVWLEASNIQVDDVIQCGVWGIKMPVA